MYDVVLDTFIKQGWFEKPERPSFEKHIFPILHRLSKLQWVNYGFFFLFGFNSPADFTDPELKSQLSDQSEDNLNLRMKVFEWFRNPTEIQPRPDLIPPIYGDTFDDITYDADRELAVTEFQYECLKKWATGDFDPTIELEPDGIPTTINQQTEALTRAALEECLGGPFHPGIELTWIMRVPSMWEKPFRLKLLPEGILPETYFGEEITPEIVLRENGPLNATGPGSLTRWLGIPWQTDEASCHAGYDTSTYLPLPSFWSARVPNFVLPQESFERLSDSKLSVG